MANAIDRACQLTHERTHFDDVECPDKGLERPEFTNTDPKHRNAEECKAWQRHYECLYRQRLLHCPNSQRPEICNDEIKTVISKVLNNLRIVCKPSGLFNGTFPVK